MSEFVHSEQRQQRKLSKTARTSTNSAISSLPLRRTPPSPSSSPTPSRSPSRLPAPSKAGPRTPTPRGLRRVSSGLGQAAGSLGGLSSPDPHRILARPSPPALSRRAPDKTRRFGTPRSGAANLSSAATREHFTVAASGSMSSDDTKKAEKILENTFYTFIHNDGLKKIRVSNDLERFWNKLAEIVPPFKEYDFAEFIDHYKSQEDYKTMMITVDDLKKAYNDVFETDLVGDLAIALEEHVKTQQKEPSTPAKGSSYTLGTSLLSPRFDPAKDDASLLSTAPDAQSTPLRNDLAVLKKRLYEEMDARKNAEEDLKNISKQYDLDFKALTRNLKEKDNQLAEAKTQVWEIECQMQALKSPTPAASVRPTQETIKLKKGELEEKDRQIENLEETAAKAIAERDRLKEENEKLTRLMEGREAEDQLKERDMMAMAEEIENRGKEIERLRDVNAAMKSTVAEAEKVFRQEESREQAIREKDEQIKYLQAQLAGVQEEMEQVVKKHREDTRKKVLLAKKGAAQKGMGTEPQPITSQEAKDAGSSSGQEQSSSFVGQQAQIQQHTTYQTQCNNTDITYPPEPESDATLEEFLEWKRDPTMAAIRHLRKESLTTRTMLGLMSGTAEAGQPRTIEDYEGGMAGPKSDEIKTFKDSEDRNWPEGMQALTDDQLRQLADHPLGGEGTSAEIPQDPPQPSATSTVTQPASEPAPLPDDQYSESIMTNHVDLVRLQHLATDNGKLADDDVEFLAKFVHDQSVNPPRIIVPSLWKLANRVEAARRRQRRAEIYNFKNTVPRLHKPNFFEWPWQILKEIFLTPALDRADREAMANKKVQDLHDSYRKYVKAEAEAGAGADAGAEAGAENPDGVQRPAAPFGMPADIMRAGPRPAAAWSLLTNFLWIVMAYLMVHNVYFYWLMKRDQKEWLVSNGEVESVGWGTGCYRVCNDGYWWRAKAAVSDFIEEHLFGPSESQMGKW